MAFNEYQVCTLEASCSSVTERAHACTRCGCKLLRQLQLVLRCGYGVLAHTHPIPMLVLVSQSTQGLCNFPHQAVFFLLCDKLLHQCHVTQVPFCWVTAPHKRMAHCQVFVLATIRGCTETPTTQSTEGCTTDVPLGSPQQGGPHPYIDRA